MHRSYFLTCSAPTVPFHPDLTRDGTRLEWSFSFNVCVCVCVCVAITRNNCHIKHWWQHAHKPTWSLPARRTPCSDPLSLSLLLTPCDAIMYVTVCSSLFSLSAYSTILSLSVCTISPYIYIYIYIYIYSITLSPLTVFLPSFLHHASPTSDRLFLSCCYWLASV